jgi:Peptidase M66
MLERRSAGRLATSVVAAAVLGAGCDTVQVVNSAGDAGILVDGKRNAAVSDEGYVVNHVGPVDIDVGYLESATGPDEQNLVIGFGSEYAPTYLDTPWTTATEQFALTLNEPVEVSITMWIVQGPLHYQLTHAADAVAYLEAVWSAERAGLVIGTVDYRDATTDPDITASILDSTGGDNRNWQEFSDNIGEDTDRIDVYWINTVEGSYTTGWSDSGNRIVMGAATFEDLLVHEVGHAMNLKHPGLFNPDFDNTNVMDQSSVVREFLTEGQSFRMHFDSGSAANDVFGANPAEPKTDCDELDGNSVCPVLERRLWDDGAFLAN